jgi:hypothetical protein
MLRKVGCLIFLTLMLAGCAAKTPRFEEKLAEQTAVAFYKALSAGHYAQADALYAGNYESLISFSTLISPTDHVALWKNACETSGLQCLPIERIVSTERYPVTQTNPQPAFKITVEFRDRSGKIFVQAPCCGASATAMPPISLFTVDVLERDGKFYVTNLPVYTP